MQPDISCSSCKANLQQKDVFSHVESFHIGERPAESLYTMSCGTCSFQCCQLTGSRMIDHIFRTEHEATGITLQWKLDLAEEANRVIDVVKEGVKVLEGSRKSPPSLKVSSELRKERSESFASNRKKGVFSEVPTTAMQRIKGRKRRAAFNKISKANCVLKAQKIKSIEILADYASDLGAPGLFDENPMISFSNENSEIGKEFLDSQNMNYLLKEEIIESVEEDEQVMTVEDEQINQSSSVSEEATDSPIDPIDPASNNYMDNNSLEEEEKFYRPNMGLDRSEHERSHDGLPMKLSRNSPTPHFESATDQLSPWNFTVSEPMREEKEGCQSLDEQYIFGGSGKPREIQSISRENGNRSGTEVGLRTKSTKCRLCSAEIPLKKNQSQMIDYLIIHFTRRHSKVEIVQCTGCERKFCEVPAYHRHLRGKKCSGEKVSLKTTEKEEYLRDGLENCFPDWNFDHELRHSGRLGNFNSVTVRKSIAENNRVKEPKKGDCHLCPQNGLFKKGKMIEHAIAHTMLRPYRCSVCPAKFNSPSILKRHIERHQISSDHLVAPNISITKEDKAAIYKMLESTFPEFDWKRRISESRDYGNLQLKDNES